MKNAGKMQEGGREMQEGYKVREENAGRIQEECRSGSSHTIENAGKIQKIG